jgi:hypothetical protein
MECKTPIELKQYDDYAINNNFTSITTNGPPMEFINNIDKESALRNQGIAKQKNNDMGVFVLSRVATYTPPPPPTAGRKRRRTPNFDTPVFAANRRIKHRKHGYRLK